MTDMAMGAEEKTDDERDLSESSGYADIMEIAAAIGSTAEEDTSAGHGITRAAEDERDDDLHNLAAGYGGVAAASLVPASESGSRTRAKEAKPGKSGRSTPPKKAPASEVATPARTKAPESSDEAIPIAAVTSAAPAAEAKSGGGSVLMMLGGLALLGGIVAFATLRDDGGPAEQPGDRSNAAAELDAGDPAREAPSRVARAEPEPDPDPGPGEPAVAAVEEEVEAAATGGALDEPEEQLEISDEDEDEAEPERERSSPSSTPKRRSKPAQKTHGGDEADTPPAGPEPEPEPKPEPEPAAPKAAPAEEKPGDSESKYSTDCLLDPDKPGCAKARKKEAPKKTADLDANLPPKLTPTQIRSALSAKRGKAKACGGKHGAEPGTKVRVKLSISGDSGKVVSASAMSPHDGTPLGQCVANALGEASFPRFETEQQGTVYPVNL